MQGNSDFFDRYFPSLSGYHSAFRWQKRLFVQFCGGDIPDSVCIPTGCGKTSVIPIWLLALAYTARRGGGILPRRLVWVVNRRVVVDQATDEAELLRKRLGEAGPPELADVRAALCSMCGEADGPLGVSTLRGQFADNSEWRSDPARPAIITGTVDMIGSRLLFSGYGRGFKSRPLHAGFLGQDALLVHDEAHLEPAFQCLIEAITREQERAGDPYPLRTMQLTATARTSAAGFSLTAEEEGEQEISARIHARKGIALHPVAGQAELAAAAAELALAFRESGAAVLVFLRRLADVESVCRRLEKEGYAVQRLTGTLRGLERDRLLRKDEILARFLPGSPASRREGTVYLVSTSAGEVGVNLSADHAVCDLAPFESMAQRLGRINRFGKGDARVELVYYPAPDKATPLDEACERTMHVLSELPAREDGRFDGSPAALGSLGPEKRAAAFSPAPEILPTSGILFDRWALTTVRGAMPGRPPVSDWLHGIDEWEPSQTHVAWRDEVDLLGAAPLYDPSELLDDFPLKPHELLRENSRRVAEQLEEIAQRAPDASVWIVDAGGNVEVKCFREFGNRDKKWVAQEIADCTLVLPPAAGGLEKGILSGAVPWIEGVEYDVSDQWMDENGDARRKRVWDDEQAPQGMRLVRKLDLRPGQEQEDEEDTAPRYWRWYVRPRAADDDGSRSAKEPQKLAPHCERAEKYAVQLGAALKLGAVEAEALRVAARWHDRGKDRDVWQRSIGNLDYPQVKLAKSGGKIWPIRASRYRHEFGSLLEMDGDGSDLARHLVAAHHGRARPHFPDEEAFDPNHREAEADDAAAEVPARYIRLQQKYGRWGLAYLESLLRVVDAWASQDETAPEAES